MGAVIVASRYVPRPPEDNIWDARSRGVTSLSMPVGGGFPFVNKRWAFNNDDAAVWTVKSGTVAPVQSLVGGNLPFKSARWKYDYNDAPDWRGAPRNVNRVLDLGGVAPNIPSRWKFDYNDPAAWAARSWAGLWILDQTLQLYVPSVTRQFPVDDPAVWVGASRPVNNLLQSQVVAAPLTAPRWKYDSDESAVWYSKPGRTPSVQALVGGNYPFKPPYWKWNNDDSAVWSGGPRNVNRVIDLVTVSPVTPSRWKFDNDDPSAWYSKPGAIPDNYLPVGGGFPFVPVRWKLDYDDAAVWTVKSFTAPKVQALVNGGIPVKPPYWQYNNDDPGIWVGRPSNVSILQQLVITTPLLPQRWKFDNDDAAVWRGAPANVPITITQPAPPIPVPTDQWSGKPRNKGSVHSGKHRWKKIELADELDDLIVELNRLAKLSEKKVVKATTPVILAKYPHPLSYILKDLKQDDTAKAMKASIGRAQAEAEYQLAQLEDDELAASLLLL